VTATTRQDARTHTQNQEESARNTTRPAKRHLAAAAPQAARLFLDFVLAVVLVSRLRPPEEAAGVVQVGRPYPAVRVRLIPHAPHRWPVRAKDERPRGLGLGLGRTSPEAKSHDMGVARVQQLLAGPKKAHSPS
jgi:hypothetical protein